MDKLKKLIAINVILALLLPLIPQGNIKVSYVNIDNIVETITLTNVAQEETVKEVAEVERKNFNLELDTNLRTKSNLHASDYDTLLQGTQLYGIGSALEQAEQKYNINGLYLMGLCILESGWGTSDYAVKRNNLVGWNAIDTNPNLATTFDSKEHCILFVAEKLNQNYLTEGGAYFEGYTPQDIDIHYCTDKQHAKKIVKIVKNLTKSIDNA